MQRWMFRAWVVLAILIAFSSSLYAQQTGSVVGTVVDQTGAAVPHANVILTNNATKDIRTTTSNAEGFFAFSGVVTGDFAVKVQAQGFRSADLSGIHISPEDRRDLNVSLAVATQNASVTVVADASTVTVD